MDREFFRLLNRSTKVWNRLDLFGKEEKRGRARKGKWEKPEGPDDAIQPDKVIKWSASNPIACESFVD